MTTFSELKCGAQRRLVASGHREGSLYYLDCDDAEQVQIASECKQVNNTTWHRSFSHLGMGGLWLLVKDNMVSGLDFDCSQELSFCVNYAEKERAFPAAHFNAS